MNVLDKFKKVLQNHEYCVNYGIPTSTREKIYIIGSWNIIKRKLGSAAATPERTGKTNAKPFRRSSGPRTVAKPMRLTDKLESSKYTWQ